MKKVKIVFVMALVFLLLAAMAACAPALAPIVLDLEDGYEAKWYFNEPIPDTAETSCYLILYDGERIALLKNFQSVSESGPALNQTKGSKEQTLSFRLISSFMGEEKPNIVLKVNGEILEPIKAAKDGVIASDETGGDTFWAFDYEQGGYLSGVTLSFEGLLLE